MILAVIALLLSSFLIMLSDIKRTMPDSFITMDEAKDLDIYIFSSRLSGFGSLYVIDEKGELSDFKDYL